MFRNPIPQERAQERCADSRAGPDLHFNAAELADSALEHHFASELVGCSGTPLRARLIHGAVLLTRLHQVAPLRHSQCDRLLRVNVLAAPRCID